MELALLGRTGWPKIEVEFEKKGCTGLSTTRINVVFKIKQT